MEQLKERMDFVPAMENPFKKKLNVDVAFKNIRFEVTRRIWRKPFMEKKEILHGISGTMLAGQLTAIMGPSGAGKSTLLNILAGYRFTGMTGQVLINGQERYREHIATFKKISCYIQQDDYLRDCLTVQEAMVIAADLKLGRLLNKKQKLNQIYEVLEMLNLNGCLKTLCSRLSGGQRKRLSIAFELLTNPPVIFLDEPTTGLDSSSCSQCVTILKTLAGQGRTVICTIHQPSALIFEKFTQVYALADGLCIYSGSVKELVPYLASNGLVCPTYHNPADFLLEVATGEYGPVKDKLMIKELNSNEPLLAGKPKKEAKFKLKNFTIEDIKEGIKKHRKRSSESEKLWANSFLKQFYFLYAMNILLFQKSYVRRLTVTLSHIICSALIGILFYGTGNEATMVRNNICFIFGVILFVIYMGLMAIAVQIPKDIAVLQAEHFNQWYSLTPYYLAFVAVEIPFQALNCFVAYPILYFLSGQPADFFRYSMLLAAFLAVSLSSQSVGFLLGAAVPVKLAVFLGPVGSCIMSVFGFSIRYKDSSLFFKGAFLLSYVRAAFNNAISILYDYNRSKLHCDEPYCVFERPRQLLQELDLLDVNVTANFIYMILVIVVAHSATYYCLYYRLNKR